MTAKLIPANLVRLPHRCYCALKTLCLKTDYRRWRRNSMVQPSWDGRNKRLAELIPNGSQVIDLGAGAQTLKRHLRQDCGYQPCDLVKSSPDCLVCDFNEGIYPEKKKDYDFVVCSGVLEYMREPGEFVCRILTYGKVIIISYNPWDGKPSGKFSRLAQGWVNHMRQSDLEELFQALGVPFEKADGWQGHLIYQLRPLR